MNDLSVNAWSVIQCDDRFERPIEPILHTAALLLARRDNERAAGILANAEEGNLTLWESRDWYCTWRLNLRVPVVVYVDMDDRKELQQQISDAVNAVIGSETDYESFDVRIVAGADDDSDWRAKIKQLLSGEGLTNQGRVSSRNIAARQHEGLLFRSMHEVHFYNALKRTGVPFAPLAAVVSGGITYHRVEPDFFLMKDGITMLVEIDGPYHFETPAQAHARLKFITDEGANLQRIMASECDTPEKAVEAVNRILQTIQKLRRAR